MLMNTGEKIITLFSTGIYTGYFPIAPATFSTITLGVAVYLLMSLLNPFLYGAITLALIPPAVWLSDKSEHIFQKKDSGHIVIDELVGFLMARLLEGLTKAKAPEKKPEAPKPEKPS